MEYQERFVTLKYEDAPTLADNLLWPSVKDGLNVYLVAAFAPSYLLKLVHRMASHLKSHRGFLNLVLFIEGDLASKSSGILRLHKFLESSGASAAEVEDFVNNCLELTALNAETGQAGLRVSILHTSQKRPLARGCLGVIAEPSDPTQFVSFIDSKVGDHNSPVHLKRIWEPDEYFEAQALLEKVIVASTGNHPRGILVASEEVETWLEYIASWYQVNKLLKESDEAESEETADDESDDDSEDLEGDSHLNQFLSQFDELSEDDRYGWYENGSEDLPPDYFVGYRVHVATSELVDGHAPPLHPALAEMVGPALAECACGELFTRAYGCPNGSWGWD